ncbi:hypothetical protein COCON_G00080160 [Conger conger]|uniref:Actin-binding LIM protein 3 n=1 Tax=Conger conger TaxID=82655 RepID=A0A9Q1DPI7_CONCO|nr:hypothetical protein COCON_G00080160 [Conger conger]
MKCLGFKLDVNCNRQAVKGAVPYQHGPYGDGRGSGPAPIRCVRCREVCKGEVVRVQSAHFHVKCFTCQVAAASLPGLQRPWMGFQAAI